jgi:hypothetical protein
MEIAAVAISPMQHAQVSAFPHLMAHFTLPLAAFRPPIYIMLYWYILTVCSDMHPLSLGTQNEFRMTLRFIAPPA